MNKITLAAVIGIVVLEGIALWQGINGALLSTAFVALGGLGGYEIARRKVKK